MYLEKKKLHEKQKLYVPGNLRTLVIDVTNRCNMSCSHCYAATFASATPIELELMEKALNEACEIGVFHFVLMGGEPIEDPDRTEKIINMCRPDESYINVVSNGWNMTPDVIEWLKNLKVDKIAFSLDSGISSEHDNTRRIGSYERVINAIDYTLSTGLNASISIVATHDSLYSEGFNKAYNYAKSKEIRMDIQIAMPVGRWDGNTENLITPEDAEYLKNLQLASPTLKYGHKLINRDIYSPISRDKDYCPAGTEFMSITVDGNLLPCNFLQYTLGNIRNEKIADMRQKIIKNQFFSGKHPVCLCGEDRFFIENYIVPYKDKAKPLDANKIFMTEGN